MIAKVTRTDALKLKSPAKLNLYLNVLGRRSDGYHEIETVLERIDLCDEVYLKTIEKGIRVSSDNQDIPLDNKNLAYQAAELLMKELSVPNGVQIEITKRIPIASGLGGGSSNAASVLLGLNELWGLHLTKERLVEMGRLLGTDVPFFITGCKIAIGRGRGDDVIPLSSSNRRWYLLVFPGLKVSTKTIYAELNEDPKRVMTGRNLRLTKSVDRIKILFCINDQLEGLENFLHNSLEEVVVRRYQVVGTIKEVLKSEGLRCVSMTGSGPTVFGITHSREEAIGLKEKITQHHKDWRMVVAKTY